MSMTPARERAFHVLAEQQRQGRLARESNETNEAVGYIYWQSARWLIDEGLAYFPSGSTMLAFTDAGAEMAVEMGLG